MTDKAGEVSLEDLTFQIDEDEEPVSPNIENHFVENCPEIGDGLVEARKPNIYSIDPDETVKPVLAGKDDELCDTVPDLKTVNNYEINDLLQEEQSDIQIKDEFENSKREYDDVALNYNDELLNKNITKDVSKNEIPDDFNLQVTDSNEIKESNYAQEIENKSNEFSSTFENRETLSIKAKDIDLKFPNSNNVKDTQLRDIGQENKEHILSDIEDKKEEFPVVDYIPSIKDNQDSEESDFEFEIPKPTNKNFKINGENSITGQSNGPSIFTSETDSNLHIIALDYNATHGIRNDIKDNLTQNSTSVDQQLKLSISKSNSEDHPSNFASHFHNTSSTIPETMNLNNESQEFAQNTPLEHSTSDTSPERRPALITSSADDWENVQVVEAAIADSSNFKSAPLESKNLVTYAESFEKLKFDDYSNVRNNIKTHIERRGLSAFTHFLFGPPKLNRDLHNHRDLIFCMAATSFDNEKNSHTSALQTVYRTLTGSKFDCPRYGNHWEEIGFQGRDPATDLRGTGIFSLLQLVYFLRESNTKELAKDVYKLSLHPTQNFPFCVMGINISRMCVQALREEIYNREMNRRKNVMETMNELYSALYLHLYKLWRKGKTVADSGFVLQDVETYCRKQVKTIFKDFESEQRNRKSKSPLDNQLADQIQFHNVCSENTEKSVDELY